MIVEAHAPVPALGDGFEDEFFVDVQKRARGAFDGVFAGDFAGGVSHFLSCCRVEAEARHLRGEGGLILAGEEAGFSIFDGVADADGMKPEGGQPCSHCFDDGKRMYFRD